jgi:hypothetical protein
MHAMQRLESRTLFAAYTAATPSELIADINAANASSGADTITLAAGATFSLTAADNTTNGATGLPTIAAGGGPLTILGNGDTIERNAATGTPAFRLFDVAAGASLTLKNLTLQGGLSTGPSVFSGQPPTQGGAIYSQGALNLESVTVQNNTALGRGGFFAWGGLVDGADAQGGGLYSAGSLSLSNCTIRNNRAIGGQGLDKAWYTITGSGGTGTSVTVYTGTVGGDGAGGGIYVASGTAAIRTTTLTANSTIAGTGGNGKGTSVANGLYINATASVGLDLFSKKNIKNPDIVGKFNVIA